MDRTFLPKALALIVLTGGLTLAGAQQTQAPAPDNGQPAAAPMHHHEHNPQREAAHLAKKLNLTPDQTAKIEPILADRDQKMADMRANTSLSPQDMHKGMRDLNLSTKQQMEAILTPDQMAQLKAMRKHREHGEQGEQPAPPPSGL